VEQWCQLGIFALLVIAAIIWFYRHTQRVEREKAATEECIRRTVAKLCAEIAEELPDGGAGDRIRRRFGLDGKAKAATLQS
jgi:hypothetical protein